MNKNKDLWHFFVMDGEEYLVVGYNGKLGANDCICVKLSSFHSADQDRLDELIMSGDAQNEPYLIRIIRHAPYAISEDGYTSLETWWNRIFIYSFRMPLEQLKGRIANSQYEIFEKDYADYKDAPIKCVVSPAKTENNDEILFGPIGRVLEV